LEAVALDTTRIVEIVSFVPEDEIDELYYNAPYFITPQEEDYANEAFAVSHPTLDEVR
jgi:DNA end-binding protein Ku